VTGRPGLLPLIYGVGVAFAAVYEVFLYDPRAYTAVHDAAQAAIAVPVLALAAMLGVARSDAQSTVGAPQQLLAGTLVGIVGPAIVLGISGASAGGVPVNASAWAGLVYPLAAMLAIRNATPPALSRPQPTPTERRFRFFWTGSGRLL